MERIIIRTKNAKTVIKTEGFSGPACQAATANLERLLGAKTKDTATEEMYREPGNAETLYN